MVACCVRGCARVLQLVLVLGCARVLQLVLERIEELACLRSATCSWSIRALEYFTSACCSCGFRNLADTRSLTVLDLAL